MTKNIYLPVAFFAACVTMAIGAWNEPVNLIVEERTWNSKTDCGAVTNLTHDIVTTQVGPKIYVHLVCSSCDGTAYPTGAFHVKYRRGYYDVNEGPESFAWAAGYESGAETISGDLSSRFKTDPTIAVDAQNRLYVFWSDSSHCDELSGRWQNMEVYSRIATLTDEINGVWTWGASPLRISDGDGCSYVPTAVSDRTIPDSKTYVFWRDGRNDVAMRGATDIYFDISAPPIMYTGGGVLLGANGGRTPFSTYSGIASAVDAVCDDAGNIHLVWTDKRAADADYGLTWYTYYKKILADGTILPETALYDLAGAGTTGYEIEPRIAAVNLSGVGTSALDLCVMFRSQADNGSPGMYIYKNQDGQWYFKEPGTINWGNGTAVATWSGALTSERVNGVVHTVFCPPVTYQATSWKDILYSRGIISSLPLGITWTTPVIIQRYSDVNTTDWTGNFNCPSVTLDANGVLHTAYFFDDFYTYTIKTRHTSLRYENDGGSNYIGALADTKAGPGPHAPLPGKEEAYKPREIEASSPLDGSNVAIRSTPSSEFAAFDDVRPADITPGRGSNGSDKSANNVVVSRLPKEGAINFTLNVPPGSKTRLTVYDLAGREIVTLFDGVARSDKETVTWMPDVPAGIYVYYLQTPEGDAAGKIAVTE